MAYTVVLAYSGGLDTSIIVPWLREEYGAEVVCMAADVGQGGELDGLETRARRQGAAACVVEDLREAFVREAVWPTLRAGAVYEGSYLLGTAMARPVIARCQAELARRIGAGALVHGCTGKGNDQVRFELTYAAFAPDLDVIAPWREWSIASREDAIAYAESHGIDVPVTREKIYSRDRNLWHLSHEGGPLEDPAFEPPEELFQWTTAPEAAPEGAEVVEIGFEAGEPVAVDGEPLGPVELLERLNAQAAAHGVGRADVIEDRLVGMKSRGIYETPGGTVLNSALRDLERLVLDRRTLALKAEAAARYADLVYDGRWWSAEREALDALIERMTEPVTGTVRVKLYKGGATTVARRSPRSLYDAGFASFGEDARYDHADAAGFIRLFSLPTRVAADRDRAAGDPASSERAGGPVAPAGSAAESALASTGRTL